MEVLEAREIPKMDSMGSSDPLVKIFTDPKRIVKTSTKKNTLNPVWENEVFYLMVQVCARSSPNAPHHACRPSIRVMNHCHAAQKMCCCRNQRRSTCGLRCSTLTS